jgi:hypothetical protein
MGSSQSSYSYRETYPSAADKAVRTTSLSEEAPSVPGYSSAFIDPASRAALPTVNPLAVLPIAIRYGLNVQVVSNDSMDPRGGRDHLIPTKMPGQLADPRLVGALLDKLAIRGMVDSIKPVDASTTSVIGSVPYSDYDGGDGSNGLRGYSLTSVEDGGGAGGYASADQQLTV